MSSNFNQYLNEKVTSESRVLDIGSGLGDKTSDLNCHVVTVDCWDKLKPSILLDVSKTNLPFKDNTFDIVLMYDFIEHIDLSKVDFVLKEAKRVCKSQMIVIPPLNWTDNSENVENKEVWSYGNIYDYHRSFLPSEFWDDKNWKQVSGVVDDSIYYMGELKKMKLGVSYNAFDGLEHLETSIRQIRDYISFVSVVYQRVSNFGKKENPKNQSVLDKLLGEGLIDELFIYEPDLSHNAHWNETKKRNIGVGLSLKQECTHHLSMDVDEIYDSGQFRDVIKQAEKVDATFCQMVSYWKDTKYRIEPKETYYVPFISKVDIVFDRKARSHVTVDPTRMFKYNTFYVFPREELEMHHLSYVRDDIRSKVENSSARGNFRDIETFIKEYENWTYPEKAKGAGGGMLTVVETDEFPVKPNAEFTVITITGDRPKPFSLLLKWMERQSVKPKQWVIVDDGLVALDKSNLPDFAEYVRETPLNYPSIRRNVKTALDKVRHEKVVFMEDDEWYHPKYLEDMLSVLDLGFDLVGLDGVIYYHYKESKHKWFPTPDRSSLCTTGFNMRIADKVRELCEKNPESIILDMDMWKINCKKKVIPHNNVQLGMKGLEGRAGQTRYHTDTSRLKEDYGGEYLYSIIGEDVKMYDSTFKKKINKRKFVSLTRNYGMITVDGKSANLCNALHGCSLFMCMSGPSLGMEERKLLANPGILKMGVNNSPKTIRPNLWVCADEPHRFIKSIWFDPTIMKFVPDKFKDMQLWDNELKEPLNLTPKVSPNTYFYNKSFGWSPEMWLDDPHFTCGMAPGKKYDHPQTGKKLPNVRSVMYPALKLAIVLGARKIFYVGADFKMTVENPYSFEEKMDEAHAKSNNNLYYVVNEFLKLTRPYLEERNIEVYNCTPNSGMDAFEYFPLKDAVEYAVADLGDIRNEDTKGMYNTMPVKMNVRRGKKMKVRPKQKPYQKPVLMVLGNKSVYDEKHEILKVYPELDCEYKKVDEKLESFRKIGKKCKGCNIERICVNLFRAFVCAVKKENRLDKDLFSRYHIMDEGILKKVTEL